MKTVMTFQLGGTPAELEEFFDKVEAATFGAGYPCFYSKEENGLVTVAVPETEAEAAEDFDDGNWEQRIAP